MIPIDFRVSRSKFKVTRAEVYMSSYDKFLGFCNEFLTKSFETLLMQLVHPEVVHLRLYF